MKVFQLFISSFLFLLFQYIYCLPSEENALCSLIQSTSISTTTISTLSSWNCNNLANKCSWNRLTCSSGSIITIDLSGLSLTGSIPYNISGLSKLTSFNLNNNRLAGTLPSTIGLLTNLVSLTLGLNSFVGTLPSSIYNLNQLQYLSLNNNRFYGTISLNIGSLTKLTSLYLYTNSFNGVLPSTIGSLTQLTNFVLSSNLLSGTIPTSYQSLLSLIYLNFGSNSLIGPIPSYISTMTKLSNLGLYSNRLSGSISQSMMTALTGLTYFHVGTNSIVGTIPPEISSLSKLQFLYLGGNKFSGTCPSTIGCLSNIIINLDLGSVPFTPGPPPDWLEDFTKLSYLSLSGNRFTGSLPSYIFSLSSLTVLSITSNSFNGRIPSLGLLTKLSTLSFASNSLTGPIPSDLTTLTQLTALSLSINSLTGTIPPNIGSLTKLTTLSLYSNLLIGPLPPNIGNLTLLSSLFLYSNRLTGTVPQSYQSMSTLTYFHIGGNSLIGTIPTYIGTLTKLSALAIYGNKFTGNVPLSFSSLTGLTYLHAGSNSFTGTLPPFFGSFTKLSYLYLGGNKFSGTSSASFSTLTGLMALDISSIPLAPSQPTWLAGFTKLTSLGISGNRFTGPFPSYISSFTSLTSLSLSYNSFNGKVPLWIGNFTRLSTLSLVSNSLSGTIPISIYRNLIGLSYLDLRFNSFVGSIPSDVGSLTKLSNFYIGNNRLVGTVPTTISSLTSLTYLILASTSITGQIPNQLNQLTKMVNLQLYGNRFAGLFPSQIRSLTRLTILTISSNRFYGSIPSWISSFNSLVSLDLGSNSFNNTIPLPISSLNKLTYLSMRSNRLTGSIPSSFTSLSSLRSLLLDSNSLASTFPSGICQLGLSTFYLTQSSRHECSLTPSPTIAPSRPTTSPTTQPSTTPTISPSLSSISTATPTSLITTNPSTSPSISPTILPSSNPSFTPTTAIPTNNPSTLPTILPIILPSFELSVSPSVTPSFNPSPIPSNNPSPLPTTSPSILPSFNPSTAPSNIPSPVPTNNPTILPTTSPSVSPSVTPSSNPSILPTTLPSVLPSILPSLNPSTTPSNNPSFNPSSYPSTSPTISPTTIPTISPSTNPTFSPSNNPSILPTTLPSISPTFFPSTLPTFLPSNNPTILPTNFPSFTPSTNPSSYPTILPTNNPTFKPSTSPTFLPTPLPFSLTSFPFIFFHSLTSSNTCLYVSVSSNASGVISCSSIPSTSTIPSVAQVFLVGKSYVITSPDSINIKFCDLYPSTEYSIYCATSSASSLTTALSSPNLMSSQQMLKKTFIKGKTLCCKTIQLNIKTNSIIENIITLDYLDISLTSPPSSLININLSLILLDNTNKIYTPFYPNVITFSTTNWSIPINILFTGNVLFGSYLLKANPFGNVANEFIYQTSQVIVLKQNDNSLVPILKLAQFQDNGIIISVKFSTPTNQGNHQLSVIFDCSTIFKFKGSKFASCSWKDESTIEITPNGIERLNINDTITILQFSGITAKCTSNYINCNLLQQVSTSTISVISPISPIIPTIYPPTPITVYFMESIHFDLSTSYGSCGRNWTLQKITIESLDLTGQYNLNLLFSNFKDLQLTIPKNIFQIGYDYKFNIKLCNFLNSCSSYQHNIHVIQPFYPIIQLISPQYITINSTDRLIIRTIITNPQSNLNISNIQYNWSISKIITSSSSSSTSSTSTTSTNLVNIKSISSDQRIFRLASSTLTSGNLYSIIATVSNGYYTSSPITIWVSVLNPILQAVINNGQTSSYVLKSTSSILLDSSLTYFSDKSSTNNIKRSWKCSQLSPLPSDSCNSLILTFNSNQVTVLIKVNSSRTFITNTIFSLTLLVSSDKIQTTSSTSVIITLIDDSLPILSLVTSNIKINPTDILQLTSKVTLTNTNSIKWSVNDPTILKLLPSITTYNSAGTYKNILTFPRSTFIGRSTPYIFIISCNNISSSVKVSINSPPSNGILKINPSIGSSFNQTFLSLASYWVDQDLPLTYQFGYLDSNNNHQLTTQIRSELAYSYQIFPAGREDLQFQLSTFVSVYDSLSAISIKIQNITVYLQNKLTSIEAQTKLNLLNKNGQNDEARNIIDVLGSNIISKTCISAPNCNNLNRLECNDVTNTCGTCKLGYISQQTGSDNLQCIPLSNLGKSCTTNLDCTNLEICSNKVCQLTSKKCSSNCSNHGNCIYYKTGTKIQVNNCLIGDNTCIASCSCNIGYNGIACDLNLNEYQEKLDMSNVLMSSLYNLVLNDDASEENIYSWQSNLYQLTRDPTLLSNTSLDFAIQLSSNILTSANTLVLDSNQLNNTIDSIDSIISQYPQLYNSFQNSIDKLALIVSNNTLIDSNYTRIYSNFRITSTLQNILESNIILNSPKSQIETILSSSSSSSSLPFISNSIEIIQSSNRRLSTTTITTTDDDDNINQDNNNNDDNNNLNIVLMQILSNLFSNKYNTDALRLYIQGNGYNNNNISFTFQNYELESYPLIKNNITFNTTCETNIIKQEKFICDYSFYNIDNIIIQHNCTGSSEVITTKCPSIKTIPKCNVMSGNNVICNVLSYNSYNTTCICSIKQIEDIEENKLRKRKLSSSIESMSLQVISSVIFISDGFVETISTPLVLDSSADFQRVLIVFLLYGTLWIGGLSLLGICTWISYNKRNKGHSSIKDSHLGYNEKRQKIQDHLNNYLDATLPSVYQSHGWINRIIEELRKHHRYIVLFYTNQNDTRTIRRRILTGLQLLTVQSLLMFMLALACDIQFPTNDGTCSNHITKESCLSRKSRVDSSRSYCTWNYNYENYDSNNDLLINSSGNCTYAHASFDIDAVIVVSIVVAIFTAPINFVIDFLFVDILGAETIDENKANRAKSRLQAAVAGVKRAAGTILNRNGHHNINLNPVKLKNDIPIIYNKHNNNGIGNGIGNYNNKDNNNNNNNNGVDNNDENNFLSFQRHTVHIPPETSVAYSLALGSSVEIINSVQKRIQMMDEFREKNRSQQLIERHVKNLERKETVLERALNEELSKSKSKSNQSRSLASFVLKLTNENSNNNNHNNNNNNNHSNNKMMKMIKKNHHNLNNKDDILTIFSSFIVDLSEQRKLLTPEQRDNFDSRWGIDPTGEFYKYWTNFGLVNNETIIKNEIKNVKKVANEKYDKLKYATNKHIGLELLHLFMLDILGRNTPAAKIFYTKSTEDFKFSYVISRNVKIISWIIIILLNVFFIYFTLLRANERDFKWQQVYMVSCVLQLVVEILFYETTETILLHFLIPNLVQIEVQSAVIMLRRAIQEMFMITQEKKHKNLRLNTTEYLFISTNLAKKFPNLMESTLIQSYQTCWPGELGQLWKSPQTTILSPWNRNTSNRLMRSFTFISLLTLFLQNLGALSPSIQKMCLHTLQPLLVSVIYLFGSLLKRNKLISLVFLPVLGYIIYLYITREKEDNNSNNDKQSLGDIYAIPNEKNNDDKVENHNNNNNNNNNNIHLHEDITNETNENDIQNNNNNNNNNDVDKDDDKDDENMIYNKYDEEKDDDSDIYNLNYESKESDYNIRSRFNSFEDSFQDISGNSYLNNDPYEISDENNINDIELKEQNMKSDISLSSPSFDQSSLLSSLDASLKNGLFSISNDHDDASSFSSEMSDYNPSHSDDE